MTCLVLEPLGIFANRSRFRQLLPEPPALPAAEDPPDASDASTGKKGSADTLDQKAAGSSASPRQRRAPLKWAQLLMRVFSIQALKCPRCSAVMVILAFISDPSVISKILKHLGLPSEPPPLSPARTSWEPASFALSPPEDEPIWDDLVISASGDHAPIPSAPATLLPLEPPKTAGTGPSGQAPDGSGESSRRGREGTTPFSAHCFRIGRTSL